MKKNIIKTALAITAGAVVSILACSCGQKGMVAAVSTEPDSLNPVLPQNTSALNINELIYDGLTNNEIDPSSGALYTDFALASEIVQGKDRKTYTVTLIDTTWHDGTALTSEDVVYSFNAYLEPANESPNREYLNSFIKSVEAVDDKTVVIVFKNPIPEFRAYPVLATAKIVPSHYNGQAMSLDMRADENTKKFATAPIGTGPYKFKEWKLGKQVTFDVNGLYFKQVPKSETLTVKRILDPVVRLQELRKGRINLILETNPADRPAIAKISDVDINSYMPYAFYQVAINTKAFSNAEGRQAMAMALNKTALVPGITDVEEGVVINNGPFPSNLFATTIPEYVKEPMPNYLEYDLDKAKALAASGNVANQNAVLIYSDSMGEFGKQLAEGVAEQLKEIGLNVEVRRTGDQVYNRMVYKEKSYELALQYCDGFDNVYSSIGSMYRSKGADNITGIADGKLNSLFDKWDSEVETKNWVDLTLQINKRVSELCPALYICTLQKDVYSRGLGNVTIASDNAFLSVEDWKFKK